jgi:xylulokinase
MTGEFIVAHDIGTTSNKAILMNLTGEIVSSTQENYDIQHPNPMWAEQSPNVLWRAICKTTEEIIDKSKVSPRDICGVSFSAQFPSTIPVDKKGNPLRPCMIWLDGRSKAQAIHLDRKVGTNQIYEITGQVLCSKSVIARILWLRENEPRVFDRTYKIIDLKDYIEYKLTDNHFITDHSCASQSALFDIRKKEWSEILCESIDLSIEKLPELHSSIDIVGEVSDRAAKDTGLKKGTPIIAGGGDNACIAVGAGASRDRSTHLCISTSAWIGISSSKLILDPQKRLFTICHIDPNKWLYNIGIDTAGKCLSWFVNELSKDIATEANRLVINPYKRLDSKAEEVEPGAKGLLFIPYMFGERTSLVNSSLRGGFMGLTLDHRRAHLFRSILEGIAYHFRWMMEMIDDLKFKIETLNMVGGGTLSKIWPQIFADITGTKLHIMKSPLKAGAVGAAYTAAVGLNIFKDIDAIDKLVLKEKEITPNYTSRQKYDTSYMRYKKICGALANL